MKKKVLASILSLTLLAQTAPFQVSAEENLPYEAENAVMSGKIKPYSDAEASGGKAAGVFESSTDSLTFTVAIPADGVYDIVIVSKGIGGYKSNNILIDGSQAGSFESEAQAYTADTLKGVHLTKGAHEITLTPSWGWVYVDCLQIVNAEAIPDSVYDMKARLINPNASKEARTLFAWLCEIYGQQILSGQFTDNGIGSSEFRVIHEATGKYPAVLGLDLMDYCPSRAAKGANCRAVERAVEFHERGGIVTISWHWNSPDKYLKVGTEENGSPRWWGGFYTSNTDLDIAAIMDGRDPEGKALLDADIAEIARQLGRLRDAGVPVLWRPLHEASGGWFWWGAKGPEAYKALWVYLYDQMTNVYHLDNLIWIWNGGAADWYPGDEYVDIIGDDVYIDSYSPSTARFREILEYTPNRKMIAMTENGTLFDIGQAMDENAKWLWFNTWGSGFTEEDAAADESVRISKLKEVYLSEHVLTLDELPDFSTFMEEP